MPFFIINIKKVACYLVVLIFAFSTDLLGPNPYAQKLAYWIDRYEEHQSFQRLSLLYLGKARYNAYKSVVLNLPLILKSHPIISSNAAKFEIKRVINKSVLDTIFGEIEILFAGCFVKIRLTAYQIRLFFADFNQLVISISREVCDKIVQDYLSVGYALMTN